MTLNLVQHRAQPNVWDQVGRGRRWDSERWLAAIGAGACLGAGMRWRSPAGVLLMFAGGALAWWAASGADERTRWRGKVRAAIPRARLMPTDIVSEASEESFPASDAPAWTSTAGNSTTRAQSEVPRS